MIVTHLPFTMRQKANKDERAYRSPYPRNRKRIGDNASDSPMNNVSRYCVVPCHSSALPNGIHCDHGATDGKNHRSPAASSEIIASWIKILPVKRDESNIAHVESFKPSRKNCCDDEVPSIKQQQNNGPDAQNRASVRIGFLWHDCYQLIRDTYALSKKVLSTGGLLKLRHAPMFPCSSIAAVLIIRAQSPTTNDPARFSANY